MKKKYIILTNVIDSVGGAQIYVRNKVKFLEELGWTVDVFYYGKGEVILSELKRFKNNGIPFLRCYPQGYPRLRINRIIDQILASTDKNEYNEIIVESHEIPLALWGELAAKRLNCKHIIYLVQETFPTLSADIYEFFDFKHKRKELAGISKTSLEMLFHGHKEIGDSEKYSLRAACSNAVDDVSNEIIDNIVREDINIGCITRLDKPYVVPMANEIICFAENYKDKMIQLVMVGSSVSGEVEKLILNKIKNIDNLKVLITGYMFPIPRNLFEKIDLFIGVSGSANVSAAEGVLTLTLDVRDNKPMGLFGYDTDNNLFSDSKKDESISEMLQQILIEKKIAPQTTQITINDFRQVYKEHLAFINGSCEDKLYYDVKNLNISLYDMAKKVTLGILGVNCYQKLIDVRTRLHIHQIK
ncbi:hypothetical protein DHBDCA_p1068 [Dehalobacter sp. DCA]|jgi:hypothetical protein|nr:hypothetical protein DHBDCA_p1068 [Dehalobacter sp. DCA]